MDSNINNLPVKYTDISLRDKQIKLQEEKIKCIVRLQQLHSMANLDMFTINDVQKRLANISRQIDVIEQSL